MEIKTKKEIRVEVKQARKNAKTEEIINNSKQIIEKFLSLPEYLSANTVFAYVDCKNEVQTLGNEMKFFEIFSYDDLEAGYFGIQEPKIEQLQECVSENGLIVLPGVAFDEQKHRVGYGGGFYDRYLELHPNMVKIALAFEFQLYKEVPFEQFDILPEKIITEERIII